MDGEEAGTRITACRDTPGGSTGVGAGSLAQIKARTRQCDLWVIDLPSLCARMPSGKPCLPSMRLGGGFAHVVSRGTRGC